MFIQFLCLFINSICLSNAVGYFEYGNLYQILGQQFQGLSVPESIITKWINQPLDHFDPREDRIWKMRYFERLDLWKPNGPVYLFIGGEGEANKFFLTKGVIYDLAKETNGALFLSEHRYYGKSLPIKNAITADKLQYLSSRQALADIARLIDLIKHDKKFDKSKVVVVGGSYAGNLAAWMKLLYSDKVDAAIASSAPVQAKKDFYEYLETVNDDYVQYGTDDCIDKINKIFKRYDKMLQTQDGINQLKEEENICEKTDMTIPENQQLFFIYKISPFMYRSQYGDTNSIRNHCEKLDSRAVWDELQYHNVYLREKECYNYDFKDGIREDRKEQWVISWTYQTCTEFGYYQSTSSNLHPFTDNVPPDFYYKICSEMFGSDFDEESIDESIRKTNELYGKLTPNVTNVVFVNGDLDPWHRLGVLEDINYNAPAKLISRSSHCRDLVYNPKRDHEEIKEAVSYVKNLVKQWIDLPETRI